MVLKVITGALAVLLMTGSAQAATFNYFTNNAPVANTTALTGFATTGSMMGGMSITVGFSDGSFSTGTWIAGAGNTGGAAALGWTLALDGDTFSASWILSNVSNLLLKSLYIDAGVGDTVFDRTAPSFGSDGSAQGRDFVEVSNSLLGTINVTYSQAVGIGGNAPVGDLFARMLVDFTGASNGVATGGLSRGFWSFGQDTDNLFLPGDLTPGETPIPGALPLFVSGLGALGLITYRRKRKQAA